LSLFLVACCAGETVQDAARLARSLVYTQSLGTLASVYPPNSTLAGHPFALMEYYAPCHTNGSLAFIFFTIAQNSHNILASPNHSATMTVQAPLSSSHSPVSQPRVALMGNVTVFANEDNASSVDDEIEACYLARHPDARWWLPGKSGFHDAHWARFDPSSLYYVGGFGGEHYIGYVPLDLYQSAVPDEKGVSGDDDKGDEFPQILRVQHGPLLFMDV